MFQDKYRRVRLFAAIDYQISVKSLPHVEFVEAVNLLPNLFLEALVRLTDRLFGISR